MEMRFSISLSLQLPQLGILDKAQDMLQTPSWFSEAKTLAPTKLITFIRNTGSCTGLVFWPILLVSCFYIKKCPHQILFTLLSPIKLLPSQFLLGLSPPLAFFLFLQKFWKTFPSPEKTSFKKFTLLFHWTYEGLSHDLCQYCEGEGTRMPMWFFVVIFRKFIMSSSSEICVNSWKHQHQTWQQKCKGQHVHKLGMGR